MKSSYHKSYHQYFDILLNYRKPEIYYYKKKKVNDYVNEIYSKENNNPHKPLTAVRPDGLILHTNIQNKFIHINIFTIYTYTDI